MKYYLGPWIWRTGNDGDYWDAPVGTTARIDLRPLPCNIPGYGFFALENPPKEPGYVLLSNSLTAPLSAAAKTTLIDALGLPGLEAETLSAALAEILTTKADPTGTVRCLPLIPKLNGMLEIVLSGHGVIWERPFEGESDEAWGNIRQVLQGNYRKVRAQALLDGTDHHRKYLDALNAKYAIRTEKFIPDDLPVEPSEPRDTTVSDDFNRPNEPLDAGPWDELDGDWDVVNDEVTARDSRSPTFPATARHTTPLSSDDQESQVTVTSMTGGGLLGPTARFAAAAETCYYGYVRESGNSRAIGKVITSAPTTLWADTGGGAPPHVQKLVCDGTSLSLYDDGVLAQTIVDPSISGNLYVGLCAHSNQTGGQESDGDNFLAADLPAPTTTTLAPAPSTTTTTPIPTSTTTTPAPTSTTTTPAPTSTTTTPLPTSTTTTPRPTSTTTTPIPTSTTTTPVPTSTTTTPAPPPIILPPPHVFDVRGPFKWP